MKEIGIKIKELQFKLLFISEWSDEGTENQAWTKPGYEQNLNFVLTHVIALVQGIDMRTLKPIAHLLIWEQKNVSKRFPKLRRRAVGYSYT